MGETTAIHIYNTIREEIVHGRLKANEMLNEREMADRFHVSRVPVREAFQQLCQEDYLIRYPNRGYIVHGITEEYILEMQQVRFQLESLAVVKVIEACSDEEIRELLQVPENAGRTNPYHTANTYFHTTLARLAKNQVLYDSVYKYVGEASMAVFQHPMRFSDTHNCHKEIVDALLERDVTKALKALARDMTFNEIKEYTGILPSF